MTSTGLLMIIEFICSDRVALNVYDEAASTNWDWCSMLRAASAARPLFWGLTMTGPPVRGGIFEVIKQFVSDSD